MDKRWGMLLMLVAGMGCVADSPDPPTSAPPKLPVVEEETPTATVEVIADGEFHETKSGLRYKILEEGEGNRPRRSSTVTVHYRGWLDDGTEFDSSYKRNEPTTFPLSQVIAGWTEGLQLVKEGGKIELEIPSDLGYGARGAPGAIPPNATLHFEVELLSIN